jgi:hypothetical protein
MCEARLGGLGGDLEMFRRLRGALGRDERAEPMVKVAGMSTRRDAQTGLEALEAKGIKAELTEDSHNPGTLELWVRASEEPQARLIMGLSGRSVIRLKRKRSAAEKPAEEREKPKKTP